MADVYKNGVLAARLERDVTGHIHFAYLPDYEGPQIATSLPNLPDADEIVGVGLPAFFAGLLPEGYRLDLLRDAVKTSADDELSLLLAVGRDVPGDVQVIAYGEVLDHSPLQPQNRGESFADMDFREFFDVVDTAGIPGVQAKISSAMLSTPISLGSAAYILKLNPSKYELLVENEAHHLHAARSLRIPVAQSRLAFDKYQQSGLVVERFDRGLAEDGRIRRFALEDATQVLDVLPSRKYLVSTEEVVHALVAQTSAKPVAGRNLFLQFFFAWLTGNGDMHAKNVSILERRPGRWEVAPMYDIPCTAVFRDFDMALPIAGRTKGLRSKHWLDFIGEIDIPKRAARSAIELALGAASTVDLSRIGYEGSSLNGAQRQISIRRQEAATLLESM